MNYQVQQSKFDLLKWNDSIRAGRDMCGTYEFCDECKKEPLYPCARAAYRKKSGYIRLAVLHETAVEKPQEASDENVEESLKETPRKSPKKSPKKLKE